MNKKSIVSLFAGMGMMICSLGAAAADNLFKNYVYGTSPADYQEAAGYYDCSALVGGTARCIDDVDFIGHKFTAALIFSGGKLIMVSLLSTFDHDLFTTAMGAISKTFMLSALSDGRSQLDVIQLAATSNREEFESKITSYEAGAMSSGTLTYTFYEGVDTNKKFSSVINQINALPDNVRAAEVVLAGEGAEAALLIRFGFPKLESNKITEAAKKPVESF